MIPFNKVNNTANKVNILEIHLRVLSLFTDGYKSEKHIREVSNNLSVSSRTAKTALEFLEDKGVLESKRKGNIKSFMLRNSYTSINYLAFTEQYKLISFLERDIMIKEVITKISPLIEGIGVIFGSNVKGENDENSDLDVFVAGRYNEKSVKQISENLGIELSVKCYPLQTFESKLQKDYLIKEVVKNHIVFRNAELFVEKVMNDE